MTIGEQIGPPGIGGQIADLSWRDAWRTELRGKGGEWVRGIGSVFPGLAPGSQAQFHRQPSMMIGEKYPGDFSYQLVSAWKNEMDADAKQHLNLAGANFDAGDFAGAAGELREAARTSANLADHNRYRVLAARIEQASSDEGKMQAAAHEYVIKAASTVTGLLGGGQEAWNGKIDIFPQGGSPGLAGQMDWDAGMRLSDRIVQRIQAETDPNARQVDPTDSALTVPLHELIHGVIPEGTSYIGNQGAYQDPMHAAVEEGFTELATIHHAGEFFEKMGIAARETQEAKPGLPINPRYERVREQLAAQLDQIRDELKQEMAGPVSQASWQQAIRKVEDAKTDLMTMQINSTTAEAARMLKQLGTPANAARGDDLINRLSYLTATPVYANATLGDYAREMADPGKVADGMSWGHYAWQTAAAQGWVQDVAKSEGIGDLRPGTPGYDRVVQLSDEINREGTATKVQVMAQQVLRAAGLKQNKNGFWPAKPLAEAVHAIEDGWPHGPGAAGAHLPVSHVMRMARAAMAA